MKKLIPSALTALLMVFISTTAYADNILQIWSCKLNDGKTTADLIAGSSAWLKAAKSMDGGADIEAFVDFPIAASTGDGGFTFVMIAPDAKTWGVFNNDYADSPAGKADQVWAEIASCSGSSLWDHVQIK